MSTITSLLSSTLASVLLVMIFLPTASLGQPVIFAGFEEGGTDDPLGDSGYGGTVTSDLTGTSDHVAEGDSAMVVTIDGDDTCSGGGCGFTGPYDAFNDKDVSPLDEDRMYMFRYMRSSSSGDTSLSLKAL